MGTFRFACAFAYYFISCRIAALFFEEGNETNVSYAKNFILEALLPYEWGQGMHKYVFKSHGQQLHTLPQLLVNTTCGALAAKQAGQ